MANTPKLTKAQRDALRTIGAVGGSNRASKYSKKQLSEWARLGAKFGKLGGRPKKGTPKKGKTK
jgi:hypothetical protein